MALPTPEWSFDKWSESELNAVLNTPLPLHTSLLSKVAEAEAQHIETGIRNALGLWVSELEPVLMYHVSGTRPYGVTSKGHNDAYISIEWDDNFYLSDRPATYPVRLRVRS
jgi:hypothetical protein